MAIFNSYVKLPEGKWSKMGIDMDLSTSRGESENGSLLFILFLWAIWSSQIRLWKVILSGFMRTMATLSTITEDPGPVGNLKARALEPWSVHKCDDCTWIFIYIYTCVYIIIYNYIWLYIHTYIYMYVGLWGLGTFLKLRKKAYHVNQTSQNLGNLSWFISWCPLL